MSIIYKRPAELEMMAEAGVLQYQVHEAIAREVAPGVTTQHLNDVAHDAILKFGARPTFLGYKGYPATIQTSINEVIVHGIPSSNRRLRNGDIVTVDTALQYKGWVADSARSYAIGEVSATAKRLLEVTEAALWAGIKAAQAGRRLGDVSWAVQKTVESAGFSVVREFVGHGVGRSMHEDPQVPNWGQPGKGPVLRPGMTFALEPMVTVGRTKVSVLQDGWTAVTADGSLSAQYEHTIAITERGPRVLTLPAGVPLGPTYKPLEVVGAR
ncbi:MAG: type I methionyl aminopeptidase [Pleurocapsa sp. SU_196_0]|nr:type I methionyl aminopeptidase [Pleurocapsa sp. SU_196_0]